ncbi:MAG TPA: DUF3237 family protein [Polyangiaceae bacterium]|jgi:hypothetical protein|nr:DUF3237 family protein [Polyangiaceae bacterium]
MPKEPVPKQPPGNTRGRKSDTRELPGGIDPLLAGDAEVEEVVPKGEPDNGYRFWVASQLSTIEGDRAGMVGPRGMRMQVLYGQRSEVGVELGEGKAQVPRPDFDAAHFNPLYAADTEPQRRRELESDRQAWRASGWKGVVGRVLSGSDFLEIRADGVIELNGRVTLRADDATLIDASYSGLIDLEAFLDPALLATNGEKDLAKVSLGYELFVSGNFPKQDLPIRLFITFDTSTGPWSTEMAEDVTWTKPSQARHRGNVWKYVELVRRQYLGVGSLRFSYSPGSLPKPQEIYVEVYDLACFKGNGR